MTALRPLTAISRGKEAWRLQQILGKLHAGDGPERGIGRRWRHWRIAGAFERLLRRELDQPRVLSCRWQREHHLPGEQQPNVGAIYRYDPYGNLISKSGPLADANVYRFSSKELHVNSGLYYYLYRFYSPNWQRWISRDPLGEPGFELIHGDAPDATGDGPNHYFLAGNNPITFRDPFGLDYGTGYAAYQQCIKDCEGIRLPCKIAAALEGAVIGWMGPGFWKFMSVPCGLGVKGEMDQKCDEAVSACKLACEKKTSYTPPDKRRTAAARR